MGAADVAAARRRLCRMALGSLPCGRPAHSKAGAAKHQRQDTTAQKNEPCKAIPSGQQGTMKPVVDIHSVWQASTTVPASV